MKENTSTTPELTPMVKNSAPPIAVITTPMASMQATIHPLGGTGGYGELVHQIGQGDVHGCLGQHAEECADVQAEHHLMRMVEMPGFRSVMGVMEISGAGFAGGHGGGAG